MCIDTDTRTKVNSKLSKLDDETKQKSFENLFQT